MGVTTYERTPEHRARMSALLKGNPKLIAARKNKVPAWKGERAGYSAVHLRLRKSLPRQCAHCGTTVRLHVALKHEATGLRAEWRPGTVARGLLYTTDVGCYMRLCGSCHFRYDGLNRNFTGGGRRGVR